MVRGLQLFRDHFIDFADRYILIGGTACDLAMTGAGLVFRATRDLDIVLCIEALDREFAERFWSFVRSGGYKQREKSSGEKQFYRFQDPTDKAYPEMLELFSRAPDALDISDASGLTPIPVDEEVSSLSAILLDQAYYDWIHAGKVELEGVPVVRAEHLIPLKARAWIDLRARRAAGEKIDKGKIKKHKNDVFRLVQVIDPEHRASLPDTISADMQRFIAEVADEPPDLKSIGVKGTSVEQAIDLLRTVYQLG